MNDGVLTDFDIYMTDSGLAQVSNEVRRRILNELSHHSMSLTDLAKITKRAQSTLSVHLDKMVTDGLVSYIVDQRDSRKKIYSLKSKVVATSKQFDPEAMELSKKVLVDVADDPASVYRALVMSMILGADGMGFTFSPMFMLLGNNFGKAMMKHFTSKKAEDIMNKIKSLFSEVGMGDVSVYTFEPLTVIIKGDVKLTRASQEMLGAFIRGFITTVLNDTMKRKYVVTDSEIFGEDNNYYRMIIEPVKISTR